MRNWLSFFLLISGFMPSLMCEASLLADDSKRLVGKPAPSMQIPRMAHTANLIDGQYVLVVGGEVLKTRTMLATAEIYSIKAKKWTRLTDLSEARSNHESVVLGNGKVLIIGGGKSAPIGQPSGIEVLRSCILFDPQTNTFQTTGALNEGRSHFQAVLLPNGKVLAVGGGAGTHLSGAECNGTPNCGPLADALSSAELYDPVTGIWTPAVPMQQSRFSFTLNLLPDGGVIAIGGTDEFIKRIQGTEIYDPKTDSWSAGPNLAKSARENHGALLLKSGNLLIAGGKDPNVEHLASAEILDFASSRFYEAQSLPFTLTVPNLIPNAVTDEPMLVGGYNRLNGAASDIYQFSETNRTWRMVGQMNVGRFLHTVTSLPDGYLLVVGGANASGESATVELIEVQ